MKNGTIEVPFRKSSKTVIISLAKIEDIPGILSLQAKYHRSKIGTDPRKGFLACTFNEQQMSEMVLTDIGTIVAINEEGVVVGYSILMSSSLALEHYPQYAQLINFYRAKKAINNAVLARQYCIDEEYRGGTLVKRLFEFQREYLAGRAISASFGEVDSRNEISMKCVQHILGYRTVGTYVGKDDGITWCVVDREEY
jgi:hypothetical protein